jgi:leader peptidase (prepilin peptidase) / N-methyltransferase
VALAGSIPSWIVTIFVVLLGLAFGSFLNVCITRLPQHESIVRPRSRCPKCGLAIRALDNVPLLSWLLLRGRCRGCLWRIPWRYPAVEVATAALFLLCFLLFGITFEGIGMAILCFLLLGLAVMDAEMMRLPDAFTWTGIGLGVVWYGIIFSQQVLLQGYLLLYPAQHEVNDPAQQLAGWISGTPVFHYGAITTPYWLLMLSGMLQSAALALIAALAILAIRGIYWLLRRREGMGLGDAKLLAMIAAWLGPMMTLLTLFLAVVAAAVVGVALIVRSRISQRQGDVGHSAMTMRLPFGSFLCAAAIYAIFAGEPILTWYLRFFR